MNIRQIYTAVATAMLLSAPAAGGGGQQRLYVFYPARMNAAVLQQKLAETYPGTQVTVFGRYADFAAGVAADGPEAVLTRPVVLEGLAGYVPAAFGSNSTGITEKMVLLSMVNVTDPAVLAGKTVGMVDLLGRMGMTELVNGYFKTPPRVKRVTKTEDLLPLLIFKMAEAVLLPERLVPFVREMSKQELNVIPVPGAVTGIAVLGVRQDGAADQFTALLQRLPADIKDELGVTAWQ